MVCGMPVMRHAEQGRQMQYVDLKMTESMLHTRTQYAYLQRCHNCNIAYGLDMPVMQQGRLSPWKMIRVDAVDARMTGMSRPYTNSIFRLAAGHKREGSWTKPSFFGCGHQPPIRVSQLAPATMGLWQRMIPSSSATCAGCFGASCFGARRMSEFASGRTSAAHLWQAVAASAIQHQWII